MIDVVPEGPINEEMLVDLVKGSTGDRSWDDDAKAGLQLVNGRLVVTQTKAVHDEIRRLLGRLAQFK